MAGIVTTGSVFVPVAGVMHRMPKAQTPVVTLVTELDICDDCGSTVCDCIPPADMAALLERIDADPHGHNDLSGIEIQY